MNSTLEEYYVPAIVADLPMPNICKVQLEEFWTRALYLYVLFSLLDVADWD